MEDINFFKQKISNQQIFKSVFEARQEEKSFDNAFGYDRLVCRNNHDIFFATKNFVRHCMVNSTSFDYKILKNEHEPFEIISLEMNELGTLLAVVGKNEIIVLCLKDMNYEGNTKSYKIFNINGKIRKVLWQSVSKNDCCLVILNSEYEIKLYDISISFSSPQLIFDLKTKFSLEKKSNHCVSICFGSLRSLIGALTLYVTVSNEVYAIYPFIHCNSKICVTKESVDAALGETLIIIQTFKSMFSAQLNSNINIKNMLKSAILQHQYFNFFKKQLTSIITPRKEIRIINSTTVCLFILEQETSLLTDLLLQGPLLEMKYNKILNIDNLGSFTNLTILVALIHNSNNLLSILVLSQLKPLIMNLKHTESQMCDYFAKLELQSDVESNCNSYIKPKNGFGYIDPLLTDYSSQNLISDSDFLLLLKEKFHDLTIVTIDNLNYSCDKARFGVKIVDEKKFTMLFKHNKNLVHIDFKAPLNDFITNLHHPQTPIKRFTPVYKNLISDLHDPLGFCWITDVVTQSGDYLVIFQNLKPQESALRVFLLSDPPQPLSSSPDDPPSTQFKKKFPSTILKREPFEEITEELRVLNSLTSKKFSSTNLIKYHSTLQSNNQSIDLLHALDNYSQSILSIVSEISAFMFKLQSRIIAQINEMVSQERSLMNILSQYTVLKNIKHLEKIQSLCSAQNILDSRLASLKQNLTIAIERLNSANSVSLSKEEKSWFKELNLINSNLFLNTDRKKSVVAVLKKLDSDVNFFLELKKDIDSGLKTEKDSKYGLKKLQNFQQLQKIKDKLQEQDSLISDLKVKIEDNLNSLKKIEGYSL